MKPQPIPRPAARQDISHPFQSPLLTYELKGNRTREAEYQIQDFSSTFLQTQTFLASPLKETMLWTFSSPIFNPEYEQENQISALYGDVETILNNRYSPIGKVSGERSLWESQRIPDPVSIIQDRLYGDSLYWIWCSPHALSTLRKAPQDSVLVGKLRDLDNESRKTLEDLHPGTKDI